MHDICTLNSSTLTRTFGSPATKYRKLKVLYASGVDSKFVYLVSDRETNETMVMKEHLSDNKKTTKELQNEYIAVAQVHAGPTPCLGIVPVPRIFDEGNRRSLIYPQYSMDLFDFLDLYVSRRGRLISEDIARIWIAQMLQSISVCLTQNVIHRDLKLENVLIDQYGNCVISDFGLAYMANEDITDNVHVVGTPLYIPPEVLKNQRLHKDKNDMWSLGVVAWEIVSNSNPWRVDDDLPPKRLFEVTKGTTKGGFEKERNMSDEMFEFIVGCVCPVEERLTPSEAMQLPFFERISFESGELFPEGRGGEDLKDVVELLDASGGDSDGFSLEKYVASV